MSESSEGGHAEERLSSGQRSTLSTMLVQHESFRAPERLTLAPALAELALLLDDYLSGRRQIRDENGDAVRSADRRSLVSDVQWALEDAGANVQQAITPSLRELRSGKVARLGAIVEDRHAAKDLV
ncbi:MAG TPA: hypothetical protein VKV21_03040 [Solirubrobacteraceae bacterium]|nr:hypothetical protein [Solirubrobacteraceae bacterium]